MKKKAAYKFKKGDYVIKRGGYSFIGRVKARFRSEIRSEEDNGNRYVVDNYFNTGLVHIFSERQLRAIKTPASKLKEARSYAAQVVADFLSFLHVDE